MDVFLEIHFDTFEQKHFGKTHFGKYTFQKMSVATLIDIKDDSHTEMSRGILHIGNISYLEVI